MVSSGDHRPASPERLWMGIDLGTSAVKAVLVDERGETRSRARTPMPLLCPSPRAAEQEADVWWDACVASIQACLEGGGSFEIGGIGLTGQKHALLALDAAGAPLAPARLWADGRAVGEAAWFADRVPDLGRLTGA
ncbi:MAG: FGGY family carbohydrate kinase, partial [Planctomycetota bacterium]